ncbi:hypothetical protein ACFOY2_05420 [Nonomuraea purpurea]|uniref:WxL domain-containing protein n=1 Tax=Nonomuraea purpurea TaxID=1849276 RepID=A0ABV8FY08_9ACTN
MATSAAMADVNTGTSIKTLLQVATPSTRGIKVVEWGISFEGSTAATPVNVELIDANAAATVTAHVSAGVQPYDDPNAPASLMTLGTSATGYNASSEGTITATRMGDAQKIAPTAQYKWAWPLGREFRVAPSRFLRARVHAGTAVDAWTYIVWEE